MLQVTPKHKFSKKIFNVADFSMRARTAIILCFALSSSARTLTAQDSSSKTPSEFSKVGHSIHGEAFDEGPRQKPWRMEGIGKSHFPITTSNAEVQMWFDQGNTLLHLFWFYEAERSFRWCLKLDPECAMAYWGLARTGDDKRNQAFIREAAKLKHKVTERERMFIEAWHALLIPDVQPQVLDKSADSPNKSTNNREEKFKYLLEKICLKYPDDLEAKSLLGLANLGNNRYGSELILRQVLAADPRHPGAHHYRIHLWDGKEGSYALDSCKSLGQIAPGVGHAQHMPGHIYSQLGMWQEGAIAMDSATRVESNYMRKRMIFPFNDWNYTHNRNYLSYIQEQLGMADAAIAGAREILSTPFDPKDNKSDDSYGSRWQGILALVRALIKFEHWQEMLKPETFSWRDSFRDKMYKAYVETMANIHLGDLDKAVTSFNEHAELKKDAAKPENGWLLDIYSIQSLELQGLLALATGEKLTGLGILSDAAKREFELREKSNDPPRYSSVLYNTLGRAYLAEMSPALAAVAFEKTLERVRNDGFALSGLVEAYATLGEKAKAQDALGRLLFVWSDADPNLGFLERAKASGLDAQPRDASPGPQRNYKRVTLDHLGPQRWEPYEAPELSANDSKGKPVSLKEYRGKNVLLVFYLGQECPHCVKQLVEINKRKNEFSAVDTEILAISSNTPEQNATSEKLKDSNFRLISDVKLENAKRFKSYDDFENQALHSTILVDKSGRVRWARNGGAPFTDLEFLLSEIRRLNQEQ